jgi:hypothetical protein
MIDIILRKTGKTFVGEILVQEDTQSSNSDGTYDELEPTHSIFKTYTLIMLLLTN